MKLIAPSILSADFLNLEQQIKLIEAGGADLIHCDIMDGHFVPNITFGPVLLKDFHKISKLPLDVHLMVNEPEKFLPIFLPIKPEFLTVHFEATNHLHRLVTFIKEQGIKAGVSINPSTPVQFLSEILEYVDLVLLMTVNPGFGGQKFIDSSINKIKMLDAIRKEKSLKFLIEVDGGVNRSNIKSIADAGCDILVAGSAIFSKEISEETRILKNLVNNV
ncbi:MAG: ribulose-phosphate 3-epimerase [Ignavibacteriaceae bacterium]